ncbi:MAG: hypothetical protein HC834_06765, partial [Rhodospirillales bacterium]|nr:hypothetical protein [Rhodospirillales bacterium]
GVGLLPEFKQAWNANTPDASKDWVFVSGSSVENNGEYRISATYPENDGTGYSKYKVPTVAMFHTIPVSENQYGCISVGAETYVGILLGDIDGSYASAANNGTLKSARRVAAKAREVATGVLAGSGVAVEVIVFDRQGAMIGRADFDRTNG